MKSLLKGLVLVIAFTEVVSAADPPDKASLTCESGPVRREFGGTAWNVYACDDGRSIVVVPLAAVNGMFGYFFVTPNGHEVVVNGEGWGRDAPFQPIFRQLKKLTVQELAAIVESARAVKTGKSVNQ